MGKIVAGLVEHLVYTFLPQKAFRYIVNLALTGNISRPPLFAIMDSEFSFCEYPHNNCSKFRVIDETACADHPVLSLPYLKNFDTKGEVSPCLIKWPDGPSPRNSENHDSCSISSCKIAKLRS